MYFKVFVAFVFIIFSRLVIGLPDCGSRQRWPIYHYQNSSDVLRLLPNGVLRHYTHYAVPAQSDYVEDEIEEDTESVYYDYQSGKYCLEKVCLGFFWTICSKPLNFVKIMADFLPELNY